MKEQTRKELIKSFEKLKKTSNQYYEKVLKIIEMGGEVADFIVILKRGSKLIKSENEKNIEIIKRAKEECA